MASERKYGLPGHIDVQLTADADDDFRTLDLEVVVETGV